MADLRASASITMPTDKPEGKGGRGTEHPGDAAADIPNPHANVQKQGAAHGNPNLNPGAGAGANPGAAAPGRSRSPSPLRNSQLLTNGFDSMKQGRSLRVRKLTGTGAGRQTR